MAFTEVNWKEGRTPLVAAFVLLIGFSVKILLSHLYSRRTVKVRIPPGPRPIPILGNVHQLVGDVAPKTLAKLAWSNKNWGVMTIKLCSKTVIVVSDPEIAREMLIDSGTTFTHRAFTNFATKLLCESKDGSTKGILFSHYSHSWRISRRLVAVGLTRYQKLHGDSLILQQLKILFDRIETRGADGNHVHNMPNYLWDLIMHHQIKLMFGPGFDQVKSKEILALNEIVITCLATAKRGQLFPLLAPVIEYFWRDRMKKTNEHKHQILDVMLSNRIKFADKSPGNWHYCDILLEAETKGEIDHEDAIHILDELIIAGTDTTAVICEWGLCELANHPAIARRVQEEMDSVLGEGDIVRVDDIGKLPYLQAVMKEIYRCHPPVPLALPHLNPEQAKLSGYDIPKHSELWVNVWAISHHPKIWENPLEFNPDRFLGSSQDYSGRDGVLLPFGAGKRICPGLPLALPTTQIVLASILKRFDLLIPEGKQIDSNRQTLGSTLRLALPLELSLRKRHQ